MATGDLSTPHSVREAILRFEPGLTNSAEKRASESPVIGTLKEELTQAVYEKEKVERDKVKIEEELTKLKTDYEQVSKRLEAALSTSSVAEEEYTKRRDELQSMYDAVLGDLEKSKNKVEKLEAEIAANKKDAVENGERLEHKLTESEQQVSKLEVEITEAQKKSDKLSEELTRTKEEVLRLNEKILELSSELNNANQLLNQLKSSEARALASLGEVTEEARRLESELKKVEDEKSTLQATMRYLEPELESTKSELDYLKNDAHVDALEKLKEKVRLAKAAQITAPRLEESVSGILDGFEQVLAEVIESDVVKAAVDEENSRMRKDTDDLHKQANTAEQAIEQATNEANLARQNEEKSLDEMKKLNNEETHDDEWAHIEEEMHNKIQEADIELKTVKTREEELKKELEDAKVENESMKNELKSATKKAADAEAAKSAVEGELRRWRSERQRTAAVNSSPRRSVDKPRVSAHVGTLARVLQMEDGGKMEGEDRNRIEGQDLKVVDGPDRKMMSMLQQQQEQQVVMEIAKKKKIKLLARLAAIFGAKKKR